METEHGADKQVKQKSRATLNDILSNEAKSAYDNWTSYSNKNRRAIPAE